MFRKNSDLTTIYHTILIPMTYSFPTDFGKDFFKDWIGPVFAIAEDGNVVQNLPLLSGVLENQPRLLIKVKIAAIQQRVDFLHQDLPRQMGQTAVIRMSPISGYPLRFRSDEQLSDAAARQLARQRLHAGQDDHLRFGAARIVAHSVTGHESMK